MGTRYKNRKINRSKVYYDPLNTAFKHKEFMAAEIERLASLIAKDQDAMFLALTQNPSEFTNVGFNHSSQLLGKVQMFGY